jgi:hypothetical protein
MMDIIIAAWLDSYTPTRAEAEALARATPHLTVDEASENLRDARFIGFLHGVDPYRLMAIADHESNFRPRTVTREPGRRVSCGVMTPVPKRGCTAEELTLLGGYRAGAEHYRMWLERYRWSTWAADIAYAGGGQSVRQCARTGYVRSPGGNNVCLMHSWVEKRAAKFRRAIQSAYEAVQDPPDHSRSPASALDPEPHHAPLRPAGRGWHRRATLDADRIAIRRQHLLT